MSVKEQESEWIDDPNAADTRSAAETAPPPAAVEVEQYRDATAPPDVPVPAIPVPPSQSRLGTGEDDKTEIDVESLLGDSMPFGAGLWQRPEVTALAVLAVSCVLIFLLAQAVAFLQALAGQPMLLRIVGHAALALLGAAACWALGRLIYSYYRFRTTPRPLYEALKALETRAAMRNRCLQGITGDLRKELATFVREYPTGEQDGAVLLRLGFKKDEIARLQEFQARMSGSQGDAGFDDLRRQLESGFLSVLDAVARRRTTRYAVQVGAKTAAMPSGVLDAGLVLINAFLMVRDLCEIYRFRADRAGTWAILLRVAINTFAASKLEVVTDETADALFGEHTDAIGSTLEGLIGGALKIAGQKLGEGVINGIMMKRLGGAAMKALRPLPMA